MEGLETAKMKVGPVVQSFKRAPTDITRTAAPPGRLTERGVETEIQTQRIRRRRKGPKQNVSTGCGGYTSYSADKGRRDADN